MSKKLEIYLNSQESFRAVFDDLEIEVHAGPPPSGSVSGPQVTVLDADNPGNSPDVDVVEADLAAYPQRTGLIDVGDFNVSLPRTVIRRRMAEGEEPPPRTVITPRAAMEGEEPPPWTVIMPHIDAEGEEPPPWTVITPHIDAEGEEPPWTIIRPHIDMKGEERPWTVITPRSAKEGEEPPPWTPIMPHKHGGDSDTGDGSDWEERHGG